MAPAPAPFEALAAIAAAQPTANPAPLGLFAFALTTAMLQMHHTKLLRGEEGVMNVAWGFGIFYGGLAQFVAGIVEFKRNNIFGTVAFASYGSFWMSLSLIQILHATLPDAYPVDKNMVSAMMAMWSVFTFALCSLALWLNYTLTLLFALLGTLFALLAGGVYSSGCDVAAGWVGLATSLCAFYLAYVEMFNDIVGGGKEIIPLFRPRRKKLLPTKQQQTEDAPIAYASGAMFADCKTVTPHQQLLLREAANAAMTLHRRRRHHSHTTITTTLSGTAALVRAEKEEDDENEEATTMGGVSSTTSLDPSC